MLNTIAYYLGATIIVGVLVFGVSAAWYAALVKLYQALKDTYYMTLYVRFMRISKNRERLRKAWREADRLWFGQHNN